MNKSLVTYGITYLINNHFTHNFADRCVGETKMSLNNLGILLHTEKSIKKTGMSLVLIDSAFITLVNNSVLL